MKNDLEWRELHENLRKQMWHFNILKDMSFECLINGDSFFNSLFSYHWPAAYNMNGAAENLILGAY